jgi:hypothetical protein
LSWNFLTVNRRRIFGGNYEWCFRTFLLWIRFYLRFTTFCIHQLFIITAVQFTDTIMTQCMSRQGIVDGVVKIVEIWPQSYPTPRISTSSVMDNRIEFPW